MKKPTQLNHQRSNHLAPKLERIATAKFSLPTQLMRQYDRLQQQTTQVRLALATSLSPDLLDDCQVAAYDDVSLTLAVTTHTLANHLTHLTALLLTELKAYDDGFANLQRLRVIVVPA